MQSHHRPSQQGFPSIHQASSLTPSLPFQPGAAFPSLAKTLLIMLSALTLAACNSGYPAGEWDAEQCADPYAGRFTDPRSVQASAMMAKVLKADRGSGMAAAVMIDGELVWADATGEAGNGAALSSTAKMRLGSVSKPFTATLVARLSELGMINLDASIQIYVPDFSHKGATITPRQLLSHTSGIRHYDFSNFSESNNQEHYHTARESLFLFADDELVSAPGTQFHYSSFGYNLLGAAIENVTGLSYGDALTQYVAEPLALTGTTIDDTTAFTPCRPRFTTNLFGWLPITTIWRDHSEAYASAGVLSNPQDLVTLAHEFFAGDAVAADTRADFIAPARLNNGDTVPWALGWDIEQDANGNVLWYEHGGATNGAHASIRYYPATRTAIAGISTYNYWITDKRPGFFEFVDSALVELFVE